MRLRRDPWGHPRGLALVTWVYIIWSLAPVILAIRFAFNEGRSRSTAQGWSLRWFWEDPTLSVFNDPSLRSALEQSLDARVLRDAHRDAARGRRSRSACSAGAGADRAPPTA